jgi:hypothetical protein
MAIWSRKTKPADSTWEPPEQLQQAAVDVGREVMQLQLLALAERIRSEAALDVADFRRGVEWAALYVENYARQLTEGEPERPVE